MKRLCFFLFLSVLLTTSVYAEIVEIDNAELQALLHQNVPLVDVRTAPEWSETGVVAGSKLLTFFDSSGKYDANTWLAQLSGIADKKTPVILICRSGRRTGIISKFMQQQVGYHKVYNVTKGIRDWIKQGNPTVAP